ncbi:MAG: DUF1805 domain-containing protein [Candidatus Omnitrophica bacterium]|nr:DUF1805 domain-containing protein [Candidatus Omnitrophota bacterium]
MKYNKIKIARGYIETLEMKLLGKNLVVLRGSKGYVMCGYLNLKAAEKFKDAAIKVTGISTVQEAIRSTVFSCSGGARKLGVYKGQPVKECLRLIL